MWCISRSLLKVRASALQGSTVCRHICVQAYHTKMAAEPGGRTAGPTASLSTHIALLLVEVGGVVCRPRGGTTAYLLQPTPCHLPPTTHHLSPTNHMSRGIAELKLELMPHNCELTTQRAGNNSRSQQPPPLTHVACRDARRCNCEQWHVHIGL